MPTDASQPLPTFRDGSTGRSQFSAMEFLLRMRLGEVRTIQLVQVLAVSNNGGVTPVGTVDVQPLVGQVDGQGNVTQLPKLYGLPYFRLQGGTNAVILDPQIGDIGMAAFCDRDISAAVVAKKPSPPGSGRRHSLGDGLYIGGLLNGVPQQYVQFSAAGIEILSPTKITLQAPTIQINGVINQTGGANTFQGDITAAGTSVHTHKHGGVQTGSGQTSAPV